MAKLVPVVDQTHLVAVIAAWAEIRRHLPEHFISEAIRCEVEREESPVLRCSKNYRSLWWRCCCCCCSCWWHSDTKKRQQRRSSHRWPQRVGVAMATVSAARCTCGQANRRNKSLPRAVDHFSEASDAQDKVSTTCWFRKELAIHGKQFPFFVVEICDFTAWRQI